jgi:hypothetical protein
MDDGLLQERTRHFTYTQDVMPRIPPLSFFRQVGRQFCLPNDGNPLEGAPKSVWAGFYSFANNTVSAVASFLASAVLRTATKIRAVVKRQSNPAAPVRHVKMPAPLLASNTLPQAGLLLPEMSPARDAFKFVFIPPSASDMPPQAGSLQLKTFPAKDAVKYGFVPYEEEVTGADLANYGAFVVRNVPFGKQQALHYVAVAGAIVLTLSPLIILVAMLVYYLLTVGTGLYSRHGVRNYRDAFLKYQESMKERSPLFEKLGVTPGMWPKLGQPLQGLLAGFPVWPPKSL